MSEEKLMVARIWHGITPIAQADAYLQLMQTVAVPDYQSTPGNHGVFLLRKLVEDQAHFLLFTLWESREAVQKFAGEDISRAKYYPFDQEFLLELEPTVDHYDVFAPSSMQRFMSDFFDR